MTEQQWAEERVRLEVLAAQQSHDGDRDAERGTRQELITFLASGNEFKAALKEAYAVLALTVEPEERAEAAYAVALVGAKVSMEPVLTRSRLEDAYEEADMAESARMRAKSAMQLGAFEMGQKRAVVASERFAQAIHAFAEQGDEESVFDAYRFRTFALQMAGSVHDAFACLTEAMELAKRRGRDDALLSFRLDLHQLADHPLLADEIAREPLHQLAKDAEEAGHPTLAAQVHLTEASEHIRKRRQAEAIACAERAREIALTGPSPMVYLVSCLLIAEAEEQRHNRIGCLTALFTCQASLGDLLGERARVPVLQVIDSLEPRWGPAVFAEAMTGYRAQFRG
ncbi:MAG: tetratricopeptide (TPR) repeat protein [Myxococcota bacterium]